MPGKTIPRVHSSHQMQWVESCKKDEKAVADFQYGARLTEICLLGNVAKRVNDWFNWDAENMTTDLDAANRWLKPDYRNGWSL